MALGIINDMHDTNFDKNDTFDPIDPRLSVMATCIKLNISK